MINRTTIAIAWAEEARGVTPTARLALFVLARMVNHKRGDWDVWPSHKELAEICEVSVATIARKLVELEDAGYLVKSHRRREDGGNSSCCYTLNVKAVIETPKGRRTFDFVAEDRASTPLHQFDGGVASDATPHHQIDGGATCSDDGGPTINVDGCYNELSNDEPLKKEDSSPTPSGVAPLHAENETDLFGESTVPAAKEPKGPALAEHVETRWRELKLRHPGIASIRKIDDGLKRLIELRAKEHGLAGQRPHDVWDEALAAVDRSAFLQGRAPPGKDRSAPFRLSLSWLAQIKSFRDVIGGKYEDDGRQTNYCPVKGRRLSPAEQAGNQALARLLNVAQQPPAPRDQAVTHQTIEGSFVSGDDWGSG